MKTYLHLERTQAEALPAAFQGDDVRYQPSLVEHFLQEYTQAGDTVLDPFAGYGTTLVVAERMGRVPFGVELDEAKVRYARGRLHRPENLRRGDARSLDAVDLPEISFSITSPPYMHRDDPEDPLAAYRTAGKGYAAYLQDLRGIYRQLRGRMKPAGTVVLEVSNLKRSGQVTTLAWDIARDVSTVLRFQGEVVLCWDEPAHGNDHSYCLVYSAT